MAKPRVRATPDNRVDRWKKMWGTPRLLSDAETEEVFDEFRDAYVPKHMHKWFMRSFGLPKMAFGNRCFPDEAVFRDWDMRLTLFMAPDVTHVEATVIYATPETLEAHTFRGETRRTLRDVVIDDWQEACAIVRGGDTTLYMFIEPKMRGCVVRSVRATEDAE